MTTTILKRCRVCNSKVGTHKRNHAAAKTAILQSHNCIADGLTVTQMKSLARGKFVLLEGKQLRTLRMTNKKADGQRTHRLTMHRSDA